MIKKIHTFVRSLLCTDSVNSLGQKEAIRQYLLQNYSNKIKDESGCYQSSLLQKLEPRFMFDGAAFVTVDLADGVSHDEQASVLDAVNTNEHADAGRTLFQALGLDAPSTEQDYSQYREVVIIDGHVKDPHELIGEISRSSSVEVILPDEDGVDAITKILEKYSHLSAVHIISHGDQAQLHLGNITLNSDNLNAYQSKLVDWGEALSQTGDILFYGCNVAEGDKGQAFVKELKTLTRADIAASDDLTASNTNSGDSELEYGADIDVKTIIDFERYGYVLINEAPTLQLGWQQLGLDINGEVSGDQSGKAVAMNSDGTRVAIGALFNDGGGSDSGQVRIYDWNGTSWVKVGQDIDGLAAGDQSGFSIAMTSDGARVVIGSFINGKVQIYDYNGGTWVQTGAFFGPVATPKSYAIAMNSSGTRIAVGAPFNNGAISTWSGQVRVYNWDGVTWSELGQDINGETSGDQTGYSVAMSADGATLAIGSVGKDDNGVDSGQVRIYRWNGTSWVQQDVSLNGEATVMQQGMLGDHSGSSVAMSADGSIVAIGAPYNDGNGLESGQVRVYRWNNGGGFWVKLGNDIDGEVAGDQSGWSVVMSSDGSRIAVGAIENDGNGVGSGHVRIYHWSESAWAWKQLVPDIDGEAAGDQSGYSLAMSADGTKLIIGAINNAGNGGSSGQARVYQIGTNLGINYTENDPERVLNDELGVSDSKDVNLESARISISSNYRSGEDFLSFTNANGITGVFNTTTGVLTLTGSASLSTYQNALRSITYYNSSDNPNTATRTLSWVVNDGEADSAIVTNQIYLTAVNDAPTAINSTVIVPKNTIHTFASAEFNFADVDLNAMSSIKIISLESVGALKFDGVDVSLNQVITKTQIDTGRLTFTPVNNASGFPYDSFEFKVNDGALESMASYTMTINVNTTPTAANNTITINEDSAHIFSASEFNFSDVDGNPLAGIKITSLESAGRLKLYGLNVSLNQFVTRADLDRGQLTFTPGANDNGSAYASFGFKVSDGFVESVNSYTMAINVNTINDVPKLSSSAFTLWQQLGVDLNGEAASDNSGYSVAMSADGLKVAIGANSNNANGSLSGQVRIYAWNGSSWAKMGADIDGEAAFDQSGFSISMSADGTRVAIGAPFNDGLWQDGGQVKVYYWNGTAWLQLGSTINGIAASDFSGWSVSMSADGKRVAIGAVGHDGVGTNSGQVQIYEWNDSAWVQMGNAISGDAVNGESGYSVALNADGTKLAMSTVLNGSGQVKLYSWNGTAWVKLGQDINGEASGDKSGWSVAISADGLRLAIGAPNNGGNGTNSGQVRIYDYNGSAWVKLGLDVDGEVADDKSGWSVAMSADGTRIAIGAPYNDGNGSNSGHVRIYQSAVPILNYTENEVPKILDNTITISDVDNAMITSAMVSISQNYAIAQDLLGFFNTTNITGSFNVNTGILTLQGIDTIANYQTALRSVTYYNASDNPSTLERTVSWKVSDGVDDSSILLSKIAITPVNDAPTAANNTITAKESMAHVFSASEFNFADIDGV